MSIVKHSYIFKLKNICVIKNVEKCLVSEIPEMGVPVEANKDLAHFSMYVVTQNQLYFFVLQCITVKF